MAALALLTPYFFALLICGGAFIIGIVSIIKGIGEKQKYELSKSKKHILIGVISIVLGVLWTYTFVTLLSLYDFRIGG